MVGLWLHDVLVAAIVVTVPLLTYWRPLRRAHLLLVPVALWLIAAGWWQTATAAHAAAFQNWMMIGLLLGMFAIVPTEASRPSDSWRRAARGDAR